MPKWSIFSHTPVATTNNSRELHRSDFEGDEDGLVAEVVSQELEQRGHRVVDCVRADRLSSGQTRQRRDRR